MTNQVKNLAVADKSRFDARGVDPRANSLGKWWGEITAATDNSGVRLASAVLADRRQRDIAAGMRAIDPGRRLLGPGAPPG